MRVQGSLRVVLNTVIWPDMLVERSSKRSVRMSAIDADDGIKIYLIQASPPDCLCRAFLLLSVSFNPTGSFNFLFSLGFYCICLSVCLSVCLSLLVVFCLCGE